jgi:hypothetical protein
MRDLCSGCKTFQEIAWTEEETCRAFCFVCVQQLPPTSEQLALTFLALTVPFLPGDRVECRTGAILYDGIGVVQEISTDIRHGGTQVFPTFRVVMEEKAYPEVPDEMWFTECCLTKLAKAET